MLVWQFVAHTPHAPILAQDLLPHFEKRCLPRVPRRPSVTHSLAFPPVVSAEEDRKNEGEEG